MPRLPLIPLDAWPDEMMQAARGMIPPKDQRPAKSEKRPRGSGVMEILANHPDLAQAFLSFNRHVLWATSLKPRWRHILIVRAAVRRSCAFLWSEHVFHARDTGLTDEEIARIAYGPEAPFFEPLETALIRAADEIVDDGAISEDTWSALAAELDEKQLLDVVFTVGCYQAVAAFLRSVDLEVDPAIADMLKPT